MSTTHDRRRFIRDAVMAGGLLGSGLYADAAGLPPAQGTPVQKTAGSSKGARFRALLASPDLLVMPVISDVYFARMSELEGFPAVFTGGSWPSASVHGMPDIGLITITELIEYGTRIANATDLPLLADADDAGGGPLNVYRAIQQFERGGVAAVMMEDTTQTKHLKPKGNPLVSQKEFVDKLKAAADARKDLVICARSDALSEGRSMSEALDRGAAYAEAGADFLFFGGMRLEDHAKAKGTIGKPLMTSLGTSQTQAQAKAAGVGVLFYHVEAIGLGAVYQALQELKKTGNIATMSKMALAPNVRTVLDRRAEQLDRARKFGLL